MEMEGKKIARIAAAAAAMTFACAFAASAAAPKASSLAATRTGLTARASFEARSEGTPTVGFDLQFSKDAKFKKGVTTFKLRGWDAAKAERGNGGAGMYLGTFKSEARTGRTDSIAYAEGSSMTATTADGFEAWYPFTSASVSSFATNATFGRNGAFSSAEAEGAATWTNGASTATFSFEGAFRKAQPSSAKLYARARAVSENASKTTAKKAAYVTGKWTKAVKVTKSPIVRSLTVGATSIAVEKGKTKKLTAVATENGAVTNSVSYSSANPGIASVNSAGVVTGVREGATKVTVSAKGISKRIVIDVQVVRSKKDVVASSVTVTPKGFVRMSGSDVSVNMSVGASGATQTYSVVKGQTYSMAAYLSPKSVASARVKWTTSNPKVATVDAKGVVRTVGTGVATITAKATDGSGKQGKVTLRSYAKESKGSAYLAPDSDANLGGKRKGVVKTNAYGAFACNSGASASQGEN